MFKRMLPVVERNAGCRLTELLVAIYEKEVNNERCPDGIPSGMKLACLPDLKTRLYLSSANRHITNRGAPAILFTITGGSDK